MAQNGRTERWLSKLEEQTEELATQMLQYLARFFPRNVRHLTALDFSHLSGNFLI